MASFTPHPVTYRTGKDYRINVRKSRHVSLCNIMSPPINSHCVLLSVCICVVKLQNKECR
jgi:hypothetical protein